MTAIRMLLALALLLPAPLAAQAPAAAPAAAPGARAAPASFDAQLLAGSWAVGGEGAVVFPVDVVRSGDGGRGV